jgi:hypothetical protein
MPSIREFVTQMGADQVTAYTAYRAVEVMVTRASAPGKESERAQLAAELAAELHARGESKKNDKGKEIPGGLIHPLGARIRVLKLLAYISGANEVPALAKAMGEIDLRETARCTLDRNASEQATAALVKAMDAIGSEFRVGVVDSLSKRTGSTVALAAVQKATEDADRDLAINAIEGLANFPEPANDVFIAKATQCPCPVARCRAYKARLLLAENLMKAGAKFAAEKIYKAVAGSNADAPQKKAAEMALKTA